MAALERRFCKPCNQSEPKAVFCLSKKFGYNQHYFATKYALFNNYNFEKTL